VAELGDDNYKEEIKFLRFIIRTFLFILSYSILKDLIFKLINGIKTKIVKDEKPCISPKFSKSTETSTKFKGFQEAPAKEARHVRKRQESQTTKDVADDIGPGITHASPDRQFESINGEEVRHSQTGVLPISQESAIPSQQYTLPEPENIPEQTETAREPSRIPPEKRGGRPRDVIKEQQVKNTMQHLRAFRHKPEIVCWKRGWQWFVGVEMPKEFLDYQTLVATQDNLPLEKDDLLPNRLLLRNVCDQVAFQWNELTHAQELEIPLGQTDYLLFKLTGQNMNEGRCVKAPSTGLYLVLAPEDWQRDEVLSGPPPVSPEASSIDGYQAHFFWFGKRGSEKIVLRTATGDTRKIESKGARFELVGNKLNDANEDIGPLFGDKPPMLRAPDYRGWQGIKTIVVGEEGRGKKKWRTVINLDGNLIEQEVHLGIENKEGGWFFVRVYDDKDDLVESLDFRFLSALKSINLSKSSPFPSENGHQDAILEFLHEQGCLVQPADLKQAVPIERKGDKTIITLPPEPAYDKTSWFIVHNEGPKVEVTILIERLWWALEDEDISPSKWTDLPVALSRDVFSATSKKAIWIRFPKRNWIDTFFLGFSRYQARPYTLKVDDDKIAIPLREYGDDETIMNKPGEYTLKLYIGEEEVYVSKVHIKVQCKQCKLMFLSEENVFLHFEKEHVEEHFHITYDDFRQLNPSLPYKIYKCIYCNLFVTSDDPINPTSAITYHEERECPVARMKHRSKAIQEGIIIIDNPDEIRRYLYKDLPKKTKCIKCGEIVDDNKSEKMRHLRENHRSLIFEYA